MGMGGESHAPAALPPEKRAGTHWDHMQNTQISITKTNTSIQYMYKVLNPPLGLYPDVLNVTFSGHLRSNI
jgi:hypothetical protein